MRRLWGADPQMGPATLRSTLWAVIVGAALGLALTATTHAGAAPLRPGATAAPSAPDPTRSLVPAPLTAQRMGPPPSVKLPQDVLPLVGGVQGSPTDVVGTTVGEALAGITGAVDSVATGALSSGTGMVGSAPVLSCSAGPCLPESPGLGVPAPGSSLVSVPWPPADQVGGPTESAPGTLTTLRRGVPALGPLLPGPRPLTGGADTLAALDPVSANQPQPVPQQPPGSPSPAVLLVLLAVAAPAHGGTGVAGPAALPPQDAPASTLRRPQPVGARSLADWTFDARAPPPG